MLYVYWDESHIWGLLLWRALTALSLPARLIRAEEINHGLLSRNPPNVLLVPGGNAKKKYEALGEAGAGAVRDYVRSGGSYVGFCGGAGLGLTCEYGLGLCPWRRRAFADRMQHFVSGHMTMNLAEDSDLAPKERPVAQLLPIWWPARFNPEEDCGVRVVASYREPGPDIWIADLPLSAFPPEVGAELERRYGITLFPEFMAGQPCIIEGDYGKGRYVLSYSHLETPVSPNANRLLLHMLGTLSGPDLRAEEYSMPGVGLPAWDLRDLPALDPESPAAELKRVMEELIDLGLEHFLLFERTSWLLGWRRGLPGGPINSLYALAAEAAARMPDGCDDAFSPPEAERVLDLIRHFREGASEYLMAERLALTLSDTPAAINPTSLKARRDALFGPPMVPGGVFGEVFAIFDEKVGRLLA